MNEWEYGLEGRLHPPVEGLIKLLVSKAIITPAEASELLKLPEEA